MNTMKDQNRNGVSRIIAAARKEATAKPEDTREVKLLHRRVEQLEAEVADLDKKYGRLDAYHKEAIDALVKVVEELREKVRQTERSISKETFASLTRSQVARIMREEKDLNNETAQ